MNIQTMMMLGASGKAGVSGGSKKLSKATREVLEVISKYNESNCRDKMNEYWLRVIAAVEQAYEASKRAAFTISICSRR